MSRLSGASSSTKKVTSSVQEADTMGRKAPFGSRFLINEGDVWNYNAWDHVPPPDDQGEVIKKAIEKQKTNPVPLEEREKYNDKPSRHWDNFYKMNAANFFRNRKWLTNEFPELIAGTKAAAGPFVIAEIGCGSSQTAADNVLHGVDIIIWNSGAGNSAFPLLSMNENPDLRIFAYDYSPHAVKLVQRNPLYETPPIGSIEAAVWDLTSPAGIPSNIEAGSVDVLTLVFVMSALHPDEWMQAVSNVHQLLKPGGLVVCRDYGRYDLAQLRFKGNRLLDDNLYIRGDKTRVYFFELDELSLIFTGKKATTSQHASAQHCIVENENEESEDATPEPNSTSTESLTSGLANIQVTSLNEESTISPDNTAAKPLPEALHPMPETIIHPNLLTPDNSTSRHLFSAEQLGVDRRLLVNRKRQLKMYRVWMQGQFRKPLFDEVKV